jgi:putative pyruvate formate lyase activating enzyme
MPKSDSGMRHDKLSAVGEPAYVRLMRSGELESRAAECFEHLEACDLCARRCGVNRMRGELGSCRTGMRARVSSYGAHLGEERPLRGWRGSGTIFFGRCNLHCQYCQNYDISQTDDGEELQPEELASMMLELQAAGCHNINLVSPSHVVSQILAALPLAARGGLTLPLVYNTGGFDSLSTLRLLEGVVDIYMPDMKYADEAAAMRYSRVQGYPEVNRAAVREMHRQVGDLLIGDNGVAVGGVLVRHLVLPGGLAGTEAIARFLADEISCETYLNIMDQYHPAYLAGRYPELNRRIWPQEYGAALALARGAGLFRLDDRSFGS